jgi:hypothetical protein
MPNKSLLHRTGIAIMRPAVRGIMGLVNVDGMIENLMKMDAKNEETVNNVFDTIKQLLKDVGLEKSVLYYMFDELLDTIQKDIELRSEVGGALKRGLEKWKKQTSRK